MLKRIFVHVPLWIFMVAGPAFATDDADSSIDFSLELCLKGFAEAQPSSLVSEDLEESTEADLKKELERSSPGGVSGLGPKMSSSVDLIAGEQNGRGVLTYAGRTAKGADWALSLDVPFDKSKDQGVFFSLEGLGGDVVLSGERNWFEWSPDPQNYGAILCQTCQDEKVSLLECDVDGLKKHWREEAGISDPGADLPEEVQEKLSELNKSFFGPVAGTFWGIKGAVSRKDRGYFELSGEEADEDRVGLSLSVVRGWALNDGSLSARLIGKRDFKENEKVEKCTLVEGSILQSCTSRPLGEAEEVESIVIGLEWKRFFENWAIAPSFVYDFELEEWAAQLPVYFLQNKDDAFTGGVKLVWGSEDDELSALVFVSQALSP